LSGNTSILDNCLIRYGGHDYYDNTKAVRITNSSPTISNSTFYKNSVSVSIEGANADPVIDNNIFEEDTSTPVNMNLDATPTFSSNQFINCAYHAIGLNAGTYSNGPYTLAKQDIAGIQNAVYLTNSNMVLGASSTLTIEPGVVIKSGSFRNSYWTINGTLIAQGTSAEPIVFTSLYDDAYGGDTNNNADANAYLCQLRVQVQLPQLIITTLKKILGHRLR